jgi:hypothetical protein
VVKSLAKQYAKINKNLKNKGEVVMNKFPNKLVAVLNKSIEPGKLMNALAHMCIGFGASLGENALQLVDYHDAEGGKHPSISKMPFIILTANSNKIKNLRAEAIKNAISFVDFTDTMTIGTYQEQLDLTAKTKEEALNYFGIVLFGDWEKVSEMTRKFSLFK